MTEDPDTEEECNEIATLIVLFMAYIMNSPPKSNVVKTLQIFSKLLIIETGKQTLRGRKDLP